MKKLLCTACKKTKWSRQKSEVTTCLRCRRKSER